MSHTQPNFDQIWWKMISQPIWIKKTFDSLQKDSTECAPQFQLNSFVTMATYWVLDLPNIKDISGHLWRFSFEMVQICKWCLICMIQQAYKYASLSLWPCLMFVGLKITYILKSSGWGLGKSGLPWDLKNCFIAVRLSLFCKTISLPSFNGLRCKLAKIVRAIYMHDVILGWVYDIISNLIFYILDIFQT